MAGKLRSFPCIAFVLASSVYAQQDPCTQHNTHGAAAIYSVTALRECFSSLEMYATTRKVTLDIISNQLLPMYSYKEIAQDTSKTPQHLASPFSFRVHASSINRDYASSIAALSDETNAWVFHETLRDMFRAYNDAHTKYVTPFPGAFYSVYRFSTVLDGTATKQQRVKIIGMNEDAERMIAAGRVAGASLSALRQHIGKKVLWIKDGIKKEQSAMQYFTGLADRVGNYHSQGQRYNSLFSSLNGEGLSVNLFGLPDAAAPHYTFDDGTSIDVPWIIMLYPLPSGSAFTKSGFQTELESDCAWTSLKQIAQSENECYEARLSAFPSCSGYEACGYTCAGSGSARYCATEWPMCNINTCAVRVAGGTLDARTGRCSISTGNTADLHGLRRKLSSCQVHPRDKDRRKLTGKVLCDNTCGYSADGVCDDGGAGSETNDCDLGTDCTDCGSRTQPQSPAVIAGLQTIEKFTSPLGKLYAAVIVDTRTPQKTKVIFKLATFMDDEPNNYQKFIADVVKCWTTAIQTAALEGGRKLYIDVIGNGGGYVEAPNVLLKILFGYSAAELCEPYDFKAQIEQYDFMVQNFIGKELDFPASITNQFLTKLASKFEILDMVTEEMLHNVRKGNGIEEVITCIEKIISDPKPANWSTKIFNTDRAKKLRACFSFLPIQRFPTTEWGRTLKKEEGVMDGNLDYYTHPTSWQRGGVSVPFTHKRTMACEGLKGWHYQNLSSLIDEVVVITDGTCGSACSQFISKMYVDNLATTVSYGGLAGQPMDISAFNGGDVVQWAEVWQNAFYYQELGTILFNMTEKMPSGPLPLLPLPTLASASINFNEQYLRQLGDDALPREWYLIPASHHISYWPTENLNQPLTSAAAMAELATLYDHAAKLPKKCVRGVCGYKPLPPKPDTDITASQTNAELNSSAISRDDEDDGIETGLAMFLGGVIALGSLLLGWIFTLFRRIRHMASATKKTDKESDNAQHGNTPLVDFLFPSSTEPLSTSGPPLPPAPAATDPILTLIGQPAEVPATQFSNDVLAMNPSIRTEI